MASEDVVANAGADDRHDAYACKELLAWHWIGHTLALHFEVL
jgi:hypothetical protein